MLVLPKYRWIASHIYYQKLALNHDLIVIHDTEGNYDGAVSWFAQVKSSVSAHIVVDDDGKDATQMVGFSKVAWHVKHFNNRAIGIEMAGFAAKGFPEVQLQATANLTAYLCHRYGIPVAWSKAGTTKGICQHKDLGIAGGGHHDFTGSAATWEHFLALVEAAYKLEIPKEPWGRD
jgi:N-acetyl-anhydromuramyl-L-alanine amidase AmpD